MSLAFRKERDVALRQGEVKFSRSFALFLFLELRKVFNVVSLIVKSNIRVTLFWRCQNRKGEGRRADSEVTFSPFAFFELFSM
jgi:hypothetical protein